jgi:ligand-binding SRPBCC domain-containing protein
MRDFTREPIHESAVIHAPIERVFALSTRVELVKETLGMNLVDTGQPGYVSSGHITNNSRVVWRGWKFGLPTTHHTLITGYQEPHTHFIRIDHHEITKEAFFQDTQERGRFAFFQHDHHFYESPDPITGAPITELEDEVRFTLPFGPLGRIAATVLLAPHISSLCRQRFARLKTLAESDQWQQFLDA